MPLSIAGTKKATPGVAVSVQVLVPTFAVSSESPAAREAVSRIGCVEIKVSQTNVHFDVVVSVLLDQWCFAARDCWPIIGFVANGQVKLFVDITKALWNS